MKTLVLSNATTPHNPLARSTSSLRTSSANVETAKKAKVVDDHVEATPTTTTADVEDQSCHQDPHADNNNNSGSKEEQHLHVADEEECAPGATKSPCSKVESTKTIPVKEEPLATPAAASSPLVPVVCENTEKLQKKATKKKSKDQKVAAAAAAAGPQELSRVSQDERECYRHAIVDVPALVELLTLVGRCPVCKSPLRTDKLKTDEDTAVVHVSLKCSRSRCQFVKHWCSSPTAGISGVTTDSTDK